MWGLLCNLNLQEFAHRCLSVNRHCFQSFLSEMMPMHKMIPATFPRIFSSKTCNSYRSTAPGRETSGKTSCDSQRHVRLYRDTYLLLQEALQVDAKWLALKKSRCTRCAVLKSLLNFRRWGEDASRPTESSCSDTYTNSRSFLVSKRGLRRCARKTSWVAFERHFALVRTC